ncbi:hypothetical protein ACFOWZ_44980 [Lentzea rhizosphaerae]|uniref:Uncharacterized protein n=1 Tax=Lentzea rhizosphaerae TaxID=2041025 RepID=A0ABV8C9K9_9PSEU
MLLREMILFLEEFLRGHGPPAVAKAVVGLMSFAVLLGAVLGSTAVKSGALVAAILLVTVGGIALVTNRGAERRDLEVQKMLVSRYCNHIDRTSSAYEICEWNETLVVRERGDTHAKVTVKLRPLQNDLMFIRLKFGCGWPQPARYRRGVQLTVRSLLVDGSPGTTLHKTVSWPKDGTMTAIIHFHTPPPENSEISFSIDLEWPKRCLPLAEGSPDEFSLMCRQRVTRAVYRIVLPAGADAYTEPIGEPSAGYRLSKGQDVDGRRTVTLELADLPARHCAGVRMQLKQESGALSAR